MVEENLKLVPWLLNQNRWAIKVCGGEEDAMQVGYLGLIKAAMHYDCAKGYTFATYAGYCIRRRWAGQLEYSLRTMRNNGLTPFSLDCPIANHRNGESPKGPITLGDLIPCPDKDMDSVLIRADAENVLSLLERMSAKPRADFAAFDSRNREIFKKVVLGGETLEKVGVEYRLTKERTRQIVQNVTRQIQKAIQEGT